jgi:hypothetical protein
MGWATFIVLGKGYTITEWMGQSSKRIHSYLVMNDGMSIPYMILAYEGQRTELNGDLAKRRRRRYKEGIGDMEKHAMCFRSEAQAYDYIDGAIMLYGLERAE